MPALAGSGDGPFDVLGRQSSVRSALDRPSDVLGRRSSSRSRLGRPSCDDATDALDSDRRGDGRPDPTNGSEKSRLGIGDRASPLLGPEPADSGDGSGATTEADTALLERPVGDGGGEGERLSGLRSDSSSGRAGGSGGTSCGSVGAVLVLNSESARRRAGATTVGSGARRAEDLARRIVRSASPPAPSSAFAGIVGRR